MDTLEDDLSLVIGNSKWYLVIPSDVDEIETGIDVVDSDDPTLSSIGQCNDSSLESGTWYLITPSDVDEINEGLGGKGNLCVQNSSQERGKTFKASFRLSLIEKIAHRNRKSIDFPWTYDHCDEQSNVSVWLYTRPIGGRMDRATARRHWAVVFQWQDKAATYEGMNIDGYIQPEWHRGTPTEVEESSQGNRWIKGNYLGDYFLSPKEVNVAGKSNKVNGYKYFAGHTNCHYWAKVFAESLGLSVPQISADAEPFNAMVVSLYKSVS